MKIIRKIKSKIRDRIVKKISLLAGTISDFIFSSISPVELSSNIDSNEVTFLWSNNPTKITVSNAEYNINGGAWTSAEGIINYNDIVSLRVVSSASIDTLVSGNITIGLNSTTFDVTTIAGSISDFVFAAIIDVPLSTITESNQITFQWSSTSKAISVVDAEYSINSGGFVSTGGQINYGDTLTVRITSSDTLNTLVSGSVTIGVDTTTFDVTTVIA